MSDATNESQEQAKGEFPKTPQSHSGTTFAWSVEVRCVLSRPCKVGNSLIGTAWQTMTFPEGHGGVPDGPRYLFKGRDFGLLSYPAAQAMRWWFLAEAALEHLHYNLETRLVKHEIKYSESATPVEASDEKSHWPE
jgi:hypothetical protein